MYAQPEKYAKPRAHLRTGHARYTTEKNENLHGSEGPETIRSIKLRTQDLKERKTSLIRADTQTETPRYPQRCQRGRPLGPRPDRSASPTAFTKKPHPRQTAKQFHPNKKVARGPRTKTIKQPGKPEEKVKNLPRAEAADAEVTSNRTEEETLRRCQRIFW